MKHVKHRFPIGSVLLLGWNNIKTKPVRFTVTLLLFSVTLFLTGVGYSAADIQIANAYMNAFQDTGEKYAMVSVDGGNSDVPMTAATAAQIQEAYGNYLFAPIYGGDNVFPNGLQEVREVSSDLNYEPYGVMAIDEARLAAYGMSLVAGRLPEGRSEIALPLTLYDRFAEGGYRRGGTSEKILRYEDLLGLTVAMHRGRGNLDNRTRIVGIIDTGFNFETYAAKYAGEDLAGGTERQKALRVLGGLRYHMAAFISKEYAGELFENSRDFAAYEFNFGLTETRYALAADMEEAIEKGFAVTYGGGRDTLLSEEVVMPKEALWTVLTFQFPNLLYETEMKEELLAECLLTNPKIDIELKDYFSEGYNVIRSKPFVIAGYYEASEDKNSYIVFSDADLAGIAPGTPPANIRALLVKMKGDRSDFALCSIEEQNFGGNKMRLITIFEDDIALAKALTRDLSRLGLYLGYGFAVFSALMMFNFVSGSISAKKREIGALRAFGARSGTVFWVYAIESLLTALFASVIAVIGMFVFVREFNLVPAYTVVKVKMFVVTYKQILAVAGLGAGIALLGCALPVVRFLKKLPADLIR